MKIPRLPKWILLGTISGVFLLAAGTLAGAYLTEKAERVSAHGGDVSVHHACVNDTTAEIRLVHPLPIGGPNIDCFNPPWPLGAGWSPLDLDDEIPSGAVMSFNLASCPSDWSELVAARGRTLVGLSAGGTLAGTSGTALSNLENRAVGQHNHSASSNTTGATLHTRVDTAGSLNSDVTAGQQFRVNIAPQTQDLLGDHSHTITVDDGGSVVGTNAPYIQLLVCHRN